ncbi:MAG: helix-turn-helix domain-containing protein [Armatimonadota bacterium]|nr:helix-turn-helix domain-containing protein [Armatimonadota bacterium]
MHIQRDVTDEERELLRAMAGDAASRDSERKRARAVLKFLETGDTSAAAEAARLSESTVRKWVRLFDAEGWQRLLAVHQPRGGDFLARYDQGFWAERLAGGYLDRSWDYRAVPYGTSRSEPFTDMETFREYAVGEFMLQAWSADQRWKRPDLVTIPRSVLRQRAGHDEWIPDLIHWDNERCQVYVSQAAAAIEVETSLWMVGRATKPLSYTVKEEDIAALRNWVSATHVPLYIMQVFYDEAHVVGFAHLEELIGETVPEGEPVEAEVDETTGKATYMVPLDEGVRLGAIPEPDVEGRVFKAENGRVTVYGRLVGSQIMATSRDVLERLAAGEL